MKKLMIVSLMALALGACTQVEDGTVGLKKVYGKVEEQPVSGLVWYNPWSTDIIEMNTRGVKVDSEIASPTADIQQINVKSTTTVSLMPSKAGWMFKNYGIEWYEAIVPQIVNSVQKNEIGRWKATDIIARRSQVEANIQLKLTKQLREKGIRVEEFSLTGTSFSEQFMNAVEAKEIAVQEAVTAKNRTATIQEQARQNEIEAQGKMALANNPNLVRLRELEVQEKAIEKWEGQVPQTILGGNAVPFISLPVGKQ